MSALRDLAQQARRFVPLPVLLAVGRRRADALWQTEAVREAGEVNMRYLLEHTDRAGEIGELAREYVEFDLLRNYRRWHPRPLRRQRVEGVEWLTTKRDPDRGLVVNFMHHGQYDGMVGSLANAGVPARAVVAPDAFDPNSPLQLRQHYKVCAPAPGAPLVSTAGGTAVMAEILDNHEILVIASDVAGRTPVTFLGREMLCSFGAARLAVQTNSPVALLTSHQGPDGQPFFRIHEPMEPGGFADPADLLAEIFRRHEPAVLAWPAAYDSPYGRLDLSRR